METNKKNIFDIVIPVGPNDVSQLERNLKYTRQNIKGYRNIYIVTRNDITFQNCITVNENIFPFTLDDVWKLTKCRKDRSGWYFQQLVKLYAWKYINNILDTYLVIDCDTFFLRPVDFVKDGKCLYNTGTEYHQPYFNHLKKLDSSWTRVFEKKSGICHHMIFQKKYLEEIFMEIEAKHLFEDFYKIFLRCVRYSGDLFCGCSEYELYFNYIFKHHPSEVSLRPLKWKNVGTLESNYTGFDYISYHWYNR